MSEKISSHSESGRLLHAGVWKLSYVLCSVLFEAEVPVLIEMRPKGVFSEEFCELDIELLNACLCLVMLWAMNFARSSHQTTTVHRMLGNILNVSEKHNRPGTRSNYKMLIIRTIFHTGCCCCLFCGAILSTLNDWPNYNVRATTRKEQQPPHKRASKLWPHTMAGWWVVESRRTWKKWRGVKCWKLLMDKTRSNK